MATLSFQADDILVAKLDKMASKRRLSRSRLVNSLLCAACMVDDIDLHEHYDQEELRLIKHVQNIDLFQDLQYLGPKGAELTSRTLDGVVLFYRDKKQKLPHLVHFFQFDNKGDFKFTAHPLTILSYCAAHLLPRGLRDRLASWAMKLGGKETDIGSALHLYLSKLYKPTDIPDPVGVEINKEFEDMLTEATSEEAFNRGTR